MIKHDAHAADEPLPLSLLAQSAVLRAAGVLGGLAVLWLAILWAVAKP